jgi:hypothetical protein
VIVVLGRPGLDARGALAPRAGRIAAAAAAHGTGVELVGSVADDDAGDAAITELGKAGIGHAALLRIPAGGAGDSETRLDAADIELGLRYVSECRVLVIADALDAAALAAAVDGARYHGAALVVVTDPDSVPTLPDHATVLAAPDDDDGAFADLVGRYAAQLDAGRNAADAWRDAVDATGWQETSAADDDIDL